MQIKIFVITFILFMSFLANAKPKKEIQYGLTFNTFTSVVYEGIKPKVQYNYYRFNLNPMLRMNYIYNISHNFSTNIFIGYHAFGGKSISDTSKFKEKHIYHSLELGISPSYKIFKNTTIGLGFKGNYTPLYLYKYYGTIYQSDALPRTWYRENISDRYFKFSMNLGFNIKHQINKFSISSEVWWGLNSIGNMNTITYRSIIKETNYRLILGYEIPKKKKRIKK